ncbi:hypothetical protein L873DRAFT_1793786 [Choiromyces venosus 120613-1]|uniref:EF-hand domain-containing protein n=1 Tax=Choiromyces venosus 120613-1 TaxID=1336337 RepID=A0A3N4J9D5_9PEZI|nr:hypothetical protein L873DRAFT_1793786 [Choiromyces venosus 120613-1]
MFSTGPNNPRQGTAPPAGGRNRRAQGLRRSPPATAGASNNPLAGRFWAGVYLESLAERGVVSGTNTNSNNVKEIETILPNSSFPTSKSYLFDLDKDRMIDYYELKVAMKTLGFDVPKPELLQILREHGTPGPGQQAQPGEEPSRLAFDLFANAAGGGTAQESKIGIEDLTRVAREHGETLEEQELRAMIDEFDMPTSPRSGTNKMPSTQTPWKPMTSRHSCTCMALKQLELT